MENKKSKIPYLFFIFFAVFITADIIMIYISQKTWRGTVTEDAYEKGLKYNKVLLNNKKQQDLGYQADLKYRVISDEVARISFILKNKDNDIINNAKIKVKFVRPTQSGFDFKEELFLNKITNSYQNNIIFPLIGLWRVEIQAFIGDDVFQYVKRININYIKSQL